VGLVRVGHGYPEMGWLPILAVLCWPGNGRRPRALSLTGAFQSLYTAVGGRSRFGDEFGLLTAPQPTEEVLMSELTHTQLRHIIVKYFNLGELKTLAFDLGIEYEELEGDNKSVKALALVQYAQRHDLYANLVAYVQQARPHLDLGQPASSSPAAGPAGSQPAGGQPPAGGTTINIHGNVIGGVIGGGEVHAENIAGGDIVINNQPIPQTREEFAKQLAELKKLLQDALANNEFDKPRDAEKSAEAVAEIEEELQQEEPDEVTVQNRLEEVKERLEGAAQVAEAAGKVGAAVVKAAPILAALVKLAQIVF